MIKGAMRFASLSVIGLLQAVGFVACPCRLHFRDQKNSNLKQRLTEYDALRKATAEVITPLPTAKNRPECDTVTGTKSGLINYHSKLKMAHPFRGMGHFH